MQCDDVRDRLLLPDAGSEAELRAHLAGCASCSTAARSAGALDRLIRTSVIIEPPAALQASLAQLALASAAQPRPAPGRSDIGAFFDRLTPTFTVGAVQGVVLFLLGVAIWELWHVAVFVSSTIGSIPFALQLVASSPAASYLPDVATLASSVSPVVLWAALGVLAWVVLDAGLFSPRRDVRS